MKYDRTRAQTICPMCGSRKERSIITHRGDCYVGSGFAAGDAGAIQVVEAFEQWLKTRDCMIPAME